MSTEVKQGTADGAGATQPAADEIKNVKAEFNRKIGNLEQTNAQLLAQLQQLTSKLSPPKPATESKVSVFDDEEAYAARIKAETAAEIRREMDARNSQQAKQATVIQSLMQDYPELQDMSHDLTKKAVELYNSLSDEEKSHPLAYKAAVRDAAAEMDIKPKSKRRTSESDDFTMSGSGSGAGRQKREPEMKKETLQFAEAVGLNIKDPKILERLKARHNRKSYLTWE